MRADQGEQIRLVAQASGLTRRDSTHEHFGMKKPQCGLPSGIYGIIIDHACG